MMPAVEGREPVRPPMLPVMLDVAGRRCVVVGAGPVGAERARTLERHGARVILISPDTSPEADALITAGLVEHRRSRFAAADLDDCTLAVAATADAEVNADVADAASAAGIPCNVAGAGPRGDVTLPAALARGRLTVSVSTSGASPRLARLLRDRIGAVHGPEWEELVARIADLRRDIEALPEDERDAALARMIDGPAAAMAAAGAPRERITSALRRELSR